jgi:AraC-like DNA-binding protein
MRDEKSETSMAVSKVKKYIAAHLQEYITAKDLAKAAGYSQYHMIRIFKEETGQSPFEYIRHERLTAAAFALRQSKRKVFDVALDFVFDSHEGFTRAFAKGFGISPKKYANHPPPVGWFIPRRYFNRSKQKSEVKNMEQTSMNPKETGRTKGVSTAGGNSEVVFTQIVERPARKLILWRSKKADDYFSYCEEVGCDENDNTLPWDFFALCKMGLVQLTTLH